MTLPNNKTTVVTKYLAIAILGYFVISWLSVIGVTQLDKFAKARAMEKNLVSPKVEVSKVYVTDPTTIQNAVNDAVQKAVQPAVDQAVRDHLK
jgi:flagellar basal body-associated protein FliL